MLWSMNVQFKGWLTYLYLPQTCLRDQHKIVINNYTNFNIYQLYQFSWYEINIKLMYRSHMN